MKYDKRYYNLRKVFDNKGFNRASWIGPLMEIMKEVRPKDEADWKEKYYKWNVENLNLDNIEHIEAQLLLHEEKSYVSEFLYDRLIKMPYRGYKQEQVVIAEYFLKHFVMLEEADKKLDYEYAVDLVERDKEGNIIKAIQVKPLGGKVREDQYEANRRFKADYGLDVIMVRVSRRGNGDWYIAQGWEELGLDRPAMSKFDFSFEF